MLREIALENGESFVVFSLSHVLDNSISVFDELPS
jgi:hypothetical protein